MSYCDNCGKEILEPNTAYGINPQAICVCCIHDRRPHKSTEIGEYDHFRLLNPGGSSILEAIGTDAITALVIYAAHQFGDGPVKIEQKIGAQWLHVSGIGPIVTLSGTTGKTI